MSTNPEISYRFAARNDIPLILKFIKDLAHYEHLDNEVTATPELLEEWLFNRNTAEVIFAIDKTGNEVGFALFFYNFSTFLGKGGIYLEDLFVLPEYRSQGFGKLLLRTLAKIATERKCGRLDLSCLDWNTPAINFYKKMGCIVMDDWTGYRFTGAALAKLAAEA